MFAYEQYQNDFWDHEVQLWHLHAINRELCWLLEPVNDMVMELLTVCVSCTSHMGGPRDLLTLLMPGKYRGKWKTSPTSQWTNIFPKILCLICQTSSPQCNTRYIENNEKVYFRDFFYYYQTNYHAYLPTTEQQTHVL